MEAVNTDAAIAQQVERILGKDEVSSSNLDSSSTKALKTLRFQGFFLFLKNLNPVLKSHLATIWLLERVFLFSCLFGEEIFQRIRCFPVALLQGMSIYVHRGGGLRVAESA